MSRRGHMNGAQIRAALARRAATAQTYVVEHPHPPKVGDEVTVWPVTVSTSSNSPEETSPEPSPETSTPKRRSERPSTKEQ